VILQLHQKLGQKEIIIEKLHQEVKQMNTNYEAVSNERNQVLQKYEQSDSLWKDKYDKKQKETE
jgi:archaellum component FlaC